MAEEQQDESSKTEEPTQRRLEEARKKGQIASSREVNHFFMLLAITFLLMTLALPMMKDTTRILKPFITQPDMVEVSGAAFAQQMQELMLNLAAILLLPFAIFVIAALIPAFLQNKFVFAVEHIKPKWEKLSPLKGFGRIFGKRALVEILKNTLKLTLVGIVAVMVVLPYSEQFELLTHATPLVSLNFTGEMAGRMLIAATIILFLLAIVDYFYQRFAMLKSLRMSKQEVKDEYKQQEGDPQIKSKVRQIRRDRARKRMMANVPKADVVITNPTHYAIALVYDPDKMQAPKLVAKGVDEVARRIRELAEKHKVPIVRNPPLARILYDTTEIDDEIPYAHYQAVAKIIGYVFKLKGKIPKKPPPKRP
ncbi:MAG: flagellar biosynthesis protein FlhB [Alphaproteobacteria bacterium]